MDEWGDESLESKREKKNNVPSGRWAVSLTVAALCSVVAISFLVSFLTKDIQSRPFWVLGGCFAAPVAALMLSALAYEKAHSSMTPSTSRSAQALFALGSVLAAFLVGCFCQVSNKQADVPVQVVEGEGWSNVLIILDKSGSMNMWSTSGKTTLNQDATQAVIDLIEGMDDSAEVGLLIDVGWEENNNRVDQLPLEKRMIKIQPLTSAQRTKITDMARMRCLINENFPLAFDEARRMIRDFGGEKGSVSIIMISDGQDCTGRFLASDYINDFNEMGVKVNYLYVVPDYSPEVERLAIETGGVSVYVNNREELQSQMRQVVSVPTYKTIYKDALRDIEESTPAKIVTGILLLLLGLLIGIALTVMLSVSGQKRFQLILSPFCAILAFLLLSFGENMIQIPWIREAIAFSLLGIVLMKTNQISISAGQRKGKPAMESATVTSTSGENDEW